ncbi:unnamed protein product [Angiostrongylus costaricensis]|uniref:Sterol carrier protein 2 n=1 Tax=Angiostrongylus costaricensis TaxID=334426 RepID=A0A158PKN0_ANGCS|nr:unnamed protein product [Angiostrongylus costaricensis]
MGNTKVYVIGVGMTKFCKPGSRDWDYPDMVKEAVNLALDDCSLKYSDIEMATVSYLFGGTCCGQRALYELGLTGIPIFNVNNACASGSSGVFLCKQFIESGNADCVLACGFEKMAPGSLDSQAENNDDRILPIDKHIQVIADTYGLFPAPMMAQMFGNAGKEHMEKYGTKREHFAKIAWKNHLHSVHNPNSQFTKEYTLDQVLNAKNIYDFMGLLECSPTSDGSAAAVICSERFLEQHSHLRPQAVEIVETGLTPNDVQVIELHDCFAPNELITYEALGLCDIGKGGTIVDRGDNTYGGKWVINPSGGLISKGHPIGATGVAQVVELSNQLRGKCGKRQVPNCKLALQHNIGIGGAGVVGLYRLGLPSSTSTPVMTTNGDKNLLEKVDSSFKINIIGNNGSTKKWIINAKKPFEIEITIKDNDLMRIAAGKLRPDQAYMQGRMKMKGNVVKSTKLKFLFDPEMLKAKF